MRLDKFWVVTDPTPESTMGDICFEASVAQLALQFKGGLSMDRRPTIFTEKTEAEIEAYGRLVAMRDIFYESKLMKRILPDIAEVLGARDDLEESADELEGRIVTLADRAIDWGLSGKPLGEDQGQALGVTVHTLSERP
jgi:hypothetical protein